MLLTLNPVLSKRNAFKISALIILRNGTERNGTIITLFYGTERNYHHIILRNGTEERNGTNTFFAGENITACNSNPMKPTEHSSNKLSYIRIRRVVNDQNVHKTV